MDGELTRKIGCIYLIRCEGLHKIGCAMNPNNRFKQLEQSSAFELHLIHTIFCYYADAKLAESRLHTLFGTKRKRREWYVLDPADVEYIKTIDMFDGGHFWKRTDQGWERAHYVVTGPQVGRDSCTL